MAGDYRGGRRSGVVTLLTEHDLVPVMSLYPSYDEAIEAFLEHYVD